MEKIGLNQATAEQWVARVASERARVAAPVDFPDLPDIPPGRYIDPEFYRVERESLWGRSWLYAAHIDQVATPGSFVVWPHGRAPIVIMHGDDGVVRAFYNTCRHRGAPIVRTESGCAGRTLVCGYHGWSYDRQGQLRGVTEQRDWPAFDRPKRALVAVRCERLGNWIFVCEDADAVPLVEFLEPVARYMRHLPLADLRLVSRRVIDVACNVKVLIENFLEAYHFKLLHPGTTDRIFDSRGTNIHLWERGHSMMLSPNRSNDWRDPGVLGMPEMAGSTDIERYYNPSYCIFPNLIVPIAASGMPCVAMWPKTLRTSALEVLWFAPDWGGGPRDPLWEKRIANFDRIVAEDIQLAEPMQHTIESPGFRGVPLSYQERRIYHWHAEVDRCIGSEQIAPALRVPALLRDFIDL